MIQKIITIGLRRYVRNKMSSTITIIGLSIALSGFIVLSLFLDFEYSFEKFNKNHPRIFQVILDNVNGEGYSRYSTQIPFQLAEVLKKNPGIEETVRWNRSDQMFVTPSNKKLRLHGFFTENSFLKVMDCTFLEGKKGNALTDPFSVIISKDAAKSLFGPEAALGKTLKLNDSLLLNVTGVVEDFPENSSFSFDFLLNFETQDHLIDYNFREGWNNPSTHCFMLLKETDNIKDINRQIAPLLSQQREYDKNVQVLSQNYKDIRIHYIGDSGKKSQIIFLLSAIIFFTLIIAIINYIQITTSKLLTRGNEFATRKVAGASRLKLVAQITGESVLLCFISLNFAFILAEVFLPTFNRLVFETLEIKYIKNWQFSIFMIFISIVIGVLSVLYPAISISGKNPVKIFRNGLAPGKGSLYLRRILLTIQYVISMFLIIASIVVSMQSHFIKNKDVGFVKQHLISRQFSIGDSAQLKKLGTLKNELLDFPEIKAASLSSSAPFQSFSTMKITKWENKDPDDNFMAVHYIVDHDFLSTYEIPLLKGEFFLQSTMGQNICVINETAVKRMGWKNPVGEMIGESNMRVIGLVKDFHSGDMNFAIKPMIMTPHEEHQYPGNNILSIKLFSADSSTLKKINNLTASFFPDNENDYVFMEQIIPFDIITIIVSVVWIFSGLAIIISLMGLFGMITHILSRKTKEIGIRKVMGSNTLQIFRLLSFEFIKWIAIACLISWPLSYLGMNTFLMIFAYHIRIPLYVFPLAGFIAVFITMLSVGIQGFRASSANPANSLRYE